VSTFVFAVPTWADGAGRIMDIAGVFDDYNKVGTPEQADAFMLYLDWMAIGEDMKVAIRKALAELPQSALSLPVR
jgi:hypothetical protein